MNARRTVWVLVVVLAYYLFVVGDRAVVLLRSDRWAFRGLGVGLLLLGLVGVGLVAAELRFGHQTEVLSRAYGDVAVPDFDAVKLAVENAPEDWRAWYAAALAYDAAHDRARGRAAMRQAIRLYGSSVPT